MQKAIVNTFSGGIERDLSINKYDNTHYYDAKNMVLNTNKELSSQALNSIRGNLAKSNISGVGVKLLGYTTIRDKIILFVNNGIQGAIYEFVDDGTDFDNPSQLTLIYTHPDLIFDPDLDIYGKGVYETEAVQKVYFTDTENFFYHLNIISNPLTNDLSALQPNALELVSDITFSNIDYTVVKGGNLRSGKIQYAYQLYNVNGAETVVSPTSPLISLTASDDDSSSTVGYVGTKQDSNTNKSVALEIPVDSDTFIRLRLYAIHYDSDIALPSVRIVGEYSIKSLTTFSVTDTGQTIGSFTLEELRFIQQDFIPKTLEEKDNILFVGNIKTNYFHITDTQFDARVFRFDTTGTAVLNLGSSDEFTITTAAQTINSAFPLAENNCYNIFNDLDQDKYRYTANPLTSKKTDYRYKTDGSTLGGVGKYLSYEFITIPKVIDTEPNRDATNVLKTGYHYPKQQIKVEAPFDNYANYRTSAEYVGYQRDEIYAFAIVFYDAKGRQSFSKWIGDIRFPDNNDMPFIEYDSVNKHTIAKLLGIKFELNSAGRSALQALGVTSYQIVRCERRDSDRTVKAAGIIANPYTKSVEQNSNKMYCVSTVPTIGDCKNKKILKDRTTQEVFHPQAVTTQNGDISVKGITYLKKDSLPITDKFIDFSSPELSFNKRMTINASDFIEANAALNVLSWTGIQDSRASGTTSRRTQMASDKYRNLVPYPAATESYNLPFTRARVDTAKVFTQIDNQYQNPYIFPDGKVYSKQAHNGKNDDNGSGIYRCFGLRGTHLFGSLVTGDSLHLSDDYAGKVGAEYDHRVMYGYYRQNPAKGIYNGTDYSSRLGRTYYKASELIDIDQTASTILTSSVVETAPPDPSGYEVIDGDSIGVVFNNLWEAISNFEAVVNVTDAALEDVTITLQVFASLNGGESQGPFTIDILLEQGTTVGVGTYDIMVDQYDVWTVLSWEVIAMSTNTQYTIDPTVGTVAPTLPTYEVTTNESTVDGIVVYGGDTYIDYHIDYRSFWDMTRSSTNDTGRWSIKSIVMYPVESRVNLSLRTEDIQGYITWHGHNEEWLGSSGNWPEVNGPKYHLQETVRQGVQMWGINYPVDFGDLYQYNRAYSAMDKTKIFFPEPFDFVNTTVFDTRVAASLPKIAGEYTDSWLVFKPNSYIDVSSQYGPLVRLLNVANRLIFFQPDGVGVLSVNERALVEDNNVGKITLGSAGILPRFDYLSYTTGITTHNAAVKADTTFYYVDSQRKRIYTYGAKDVPVSAVRGVNSLLKSLAYNYVNAGFEPDANRVYFTIDDSTLVFNEFQDAFTHTMLITPAQYITLDNGFYTVENRGEENPLLANDIPTNIDYNDLGDPILISDGTTGTTIYKSGGSPTGVFNDDGGLTADCYVDLIIHPEGTNKCAFDNIELTMEILNNSDEEVYTDSPTEYQPIFDTIKQLVFSNSYMTKTVDVVYAQNIKRIGKTWKLQVPLLPDRKVPTRSARFVDTHLRLRIVFDNTTTNRLRLHDVTTFYRTMSM